MNASEFKSLLPLDSQFKSSRHCTCYWYMMLLSPSVRDWVTSVEMVGSPCPVKRLLTPSLFCFLCPFTDYLRTKLHVHLLLEISSSKEDL